MHSSASQLMPSPFVDSDIAADALDPPFNITFILSLIYPPLSRFPPIT